MKKKTISFVLTIAAILFFHGILYAQKAPAIEWQKCLGGSEDDNGKCIVQTHDSGFAIVGTTSSNDGDVAGIRQGGIWLVKLNSSGVFQWQKSLGGSKAESPRCIIQTSDEGFAISGTTTSNDGDVSGNTTGNAGWIVKLDSSGKIQWQKCLEGNPKGASNLANSIIQTRNGNYIVAGQGTLLVEGCFPLSLNAHIFVTKLNTSGNILWQKCYGGSNIDIANCILETFDGGYAFCGNTSSNDGDVSGFHKPADSLFLPNLQFDFWVVKLDTLGVIQWQKCLGGNRVDQAYSLVQSSDSGFVVVGTTNSYDGDVSGRQHGDSINRNNDLWAIKLNYSGKMEWQKCFGGSFDETGFSVVQTKDGGFVVAGETASNDGDVSGYHFSGDSSNNTSDIWILKFNSDGELLWQKCLGGSTSEIGYSIIQTSNGGFAIAGQANSNDGDVSGNHGKNDIWVVKLSPSSTVTENYSKDNFIKVYPNPSSNEVHFSASSNLSLNTIGFYDMMGRQYFPNHNLKGNIISCDVHDLTSGIYMARLGSFTLPFLVQH